MDWPWALELAVSRLARTRRSSHTDFQGNTTDMSYRYVSTPKGKEPQRTRFRFEDKTTLAATVADAAGNVYQDNRDGSRVRVTPKPDNKARRRERERQERQQFEETMRGVRELAAECAVKPGQRVRDVEALHRAEPGRSDAR